MIKSNSMGKSDGIVRGKISTVKMTMLGVGGIVGAGYFLASGIAISQAGPAILINTLISAFIMFTVFQALAEMSVAQPVAGSFRVYAQESLGNLFGFMSGWLYWLAGVLVMSSEVTASAIFTRYWFPAVPLWVFTLLYSLMIMGINLLGVEDFSSIESVFSAVKIIALVAIIVVGIILLVTLPPVRANVGPSNLVKYGGFLPHGIKGLYGAMLMSLLSFAGFEVTAMAANQARSQRTIANTMRNVITLLVVLYIGSFFVLLSITPWNMINVKMSPFVKLFDFARLPYADSIMNFIILTAALTTMNAAMYGVTQVLFSLGKGEFAPTILSKESKKGVPIYALMATSMGLIIAIILSYLLPKSVYEYITSSAGFIQFSNWIIILLAHLKFRKYMKDKGMEDKIKFRAKGYPLLSKIGIVGIIVVLLSSLVVPKETIGFGVGIFIILFLVLFYNIAKRTDLFEKW